MNNTPYTLLQLQREVKEQIRRSFSSRKWVVAEIGQISNASTGHCYMELVERNDATGQLAAKCQATIWRNSYSGIAHRFLSATGSKLIGGMKILALVEVSHHELYGLSLNISDIDPSFTIGEMEMQRREIIKKLKEDGDLERNSQIGFAQLVQRIAVVSSSKAAGYGDFCNELLHNEYGYHFNVTLFNATMQGSDAEESIISALEQIYDNHTEFDAIVIIRGGGSKSDLICFDSYPLAQMIAYAPLAVISGIGHERDESIADMVAAVALKTPTAVARFLIDYSLEKENQLDEIAEYVKDIITQEIKSQEERLSIFTLNIERILSMSVKEQSVYFAKSEERIKNIVQNIIKQRVTALDSTADRALNAATQLIDKNSLMLSTTLEEAERVALKMLSDASNKLEMQRLQNEAFNPQHIFEMGYTFAKLKGKVLRSTKDAKVGDTIDIKLKDGALEANITNINNG